MHETSHKKTNRKKTEQMKQMVNYNRSGFIEYIFKLESVKSTEHSTRLMLISAMSTETIGPF